MPPPTAIFLSGPIGAGKTTLGRMLAEEREAAFIDGDHYSDPTKPWYASSLSTARLISRRVNEEATQGNSAVVAYPLRCREWIFYSRRLSECGIRAIFVSLEADYDAIAGPGRTRSFSRGELARVREMIAQGYGRRTFSDIVIETGTGGPDASLRALIGAIAEL